MRLLPLAIVLAALLALLTPAALAQPGGAIDATITLDPTSSPTIEGPPGLVRLNDSEPGERYRFDLTLPRNYTTFEVRAKGFELERPRQLVPSLLVADDEYPLFLDFPNERIWEVDGPANVFFTQGTGDAVVLRLGVAGPRNVTLELAVDKTPPTYTLGERQNMTHIGFYQETTTDEMATGDLQVREVGATEWIQNPTPSLHVLQRFPVQGLDPATEYETQVVFTDWAGNQVTTPIARFTTPAAPIVPIPVVRAVAPAPDATVPAGDIVVRAAIDSNESPVRPDGVRLFFDLREVTDALVFDGAEVAYTPTSALLPGLHRVSVEATNELGGTGVARWSFEVEGAGGSSDTPLPGALALLGLAAAALVTASRDRSAPKR